MPTYDYECDGCHRRFEVMHGINEPQPDTCPYCQGHELHRVYGDIGVVFKGDGFYCTDKGSSHSCDSCPHGNSH